MVAHGSGSHHQTKYKMYMLEVHDLGRLSQGERTRLSTTHVRESVEE